VTGSNRPVAAIAIVKVGAHKQTFKDRTGLLRLNIPRNAEWVQESPFVAARTGRCPRRLRHKPTLNPDA